MVLKKQKIRFNGREYSVRLYFYYHGNEYYRGHKMRHSQLRTDTALLITIILAGGCTTQPSYFSGSNEDSLPVASLLSPVIAPMNEPVIFSAGESYNIQGTSLLFTFDFGDDSNPVITEANTIEHKYMNPGHFEIMLTVENKNGNRANASHDITIVENFLPPYCDEDTDCTWGDICIESLCYFQGGEIGN
jgi:hypothetical protein